MNFSSKFINQKAKSDILDSKHRIRTHGKEIWNVLHITSVFLPNKPSTEDIDNFTNFVKGILLFGTKLDKSWHEYTLKYIKDNPFNFSDRENSMVWICNFHNQVNMNLEKDLFECTKENIGKRWGNYANILNDSNNNKLSI